jgi:ABC-type antimicrobial peptide transport system permease subunit
MMSLRLWQHVFHNASRNRGQFALSAFGIVVGIAAFVFFLGLSTGVRNVLLGEVFPIERVKVVAPRTSFLGKDTSPKLTDEVVARIQERPGIKAVVPRMEVGFPSKGHGWFEGKRFDFELVGDGVAPSFAEEKFHDLFKDWETAESPESLASCGPPAFQCQGLRYCDRRDYKCHHRVPIIASRTLVEIYNSQFAKSRGMPLIGGFEEFIVERGGLSKMRVYIALGDTMVAGVNKNLMAPPRMVEGVILGLSDRAVPIGITVPIEYVKRWNEEYLGTDAAKEYSSIIVELEDKDDVSSFGAWVQNDLNLRVDDSIAEKLAFAIAGVTSLFILISAIIIIISAINIAHNFFMQVSERRREIGVLRAIGATKGDVRALILGEAALIGVVAGIIGIGLALLFGFIGDQLAAIYLPNVPFKPKTFFDFEWWIWLSGLLFSVLFCILGGLLPASRAANLAPAQALASR